MAKVALLARIRRPELAQVGSQRKNDIRESVLESLRGICSTRLGSALANPELGIPDINEMFHAFPVAVQLIARSLRTTIEAHEPRLTNVRVRQMAEKEGDLILRFEIIADMVDQPGQLKFETNFEMSRKLTIS
jgi:type VI secretion system protein